MNDDDAWKIYIKGVTPLNKSKGHSPPQVSIRPKFRRPVIEHHHKPERIHLPHRAPERNFTVEARIDLHGLTVQQAYGEIKTSLSKYHSQGIRRILIITGKSGQIRHEFEHWLNLNPLVSIIQKAEGAHWRAGGDGAFYVILKK